MGAANLITTVFTRKTTKRHLTASLPRARRLVVRRVVALAVTLTACSLLPIASSPTLAWPLLLVPLVLGVVFFFELGSLVVSTWLAVLMVSLHAGEGSLSRLAVLEVALGLACFLGTGIAIGLLLRRGRELQASLAASSLTDRLTGLYNYGTFVDYLRHEVTRLDRYGGEISLIMMDLDHFKEFNDTYGHEVGNDLLARVGATLLAHVRHADTAARYGGEEFAVLIRGDEAQGHELAQRLRRAVENVAIELPSGVRVGTNLSAGVSACPTAAADATQLIEQADAALYESKRRGRNRVTLHVGPSNGDGAVRALSA
jgi:diguanylate cyclase (GGDEF)-like protein